VNVTYWARSRLISRAEATGSSRATLPLVTSSEGREVGARSGHCAERCHPSFLARVHKTGISPVGQVPPVKDVGVEKVWRPRLA
jgi:hypothetical protein